MLYRPKLGNGKVVPLSWPLAMYRLLNIICWPLEDGASYLAHFFDRFCWILAFLIFVQHNDAELRYLAEQFHNLDQMLTGVPTYLILIEGHLRAFQLGLVKEQFKRFLQKFYAEVYIPKSSHPKLYCYIQRKLRYTYAYSCLLFAALNSFLIIPIMCLIYQRKDLLYKMIFPFDYTPIYVYIPIIFSSIWVGVIITTMLFGEANVLSEILLHLNGQFLLLRQDLEISTEKLLNSTDPTQIARKFQREVVKIIKRNVELNKFATDFQLQFSYRIFVLLSFRAALLCALGFKVYTNPSASVGYLLWMCAKILEMLALGELGSTLMATTDAVSSMYYESNWELVLSRSSDVGENVRLMKLILLAIETNQKPFNLTGLNFFSVSLNAVTAILQGAGSYFTFLISLR